AEVTAILLVADKFRKFVWLKTLKASPRSWSLTFSPNRMFLNTERSNRCVGGPSMIPRPPLPTTLATGGAVGVFSKQAVLNHWAKVCGAFAFGSHITFARFPAIRAGTLPSPSASKFVVTVYQRPLCKLTMPDTSQPPRTLPTKSWRLLNQGTS